MSIPQKTILWRAQPGIDYIPLTNEGEIVGEEPVGLPSTRMKPVPEHTREGRANSAGIPVLYLASTERTAVSEVRPWVGSELSVAQFKVTRELRAVNLTPRHGMSSWEGLTFAQLGGREETDAEGKELAVWTDIDNAFSRPVLLSDERDSYLPTRILAELFQEAGFNAIVYRSQFGQEDRIGYNVAIFELCDAEILNCAPYEVHSITVEFKQTGNRWYSQV